MVTVPTIVVSASDQAGKFGIGNGGDVEDQLR